MSEALVGAIDQGTSSSRFLIFSSKTRAIVAESQEEIPHHFPNEGWVEIDPVDLIQSVRSCLGRTIQSLREAGLDPAQVKAVGISNQRETTVAWDKLNGRALHNAIVWSDLRTAQLAEQLIAKTPTQSKDYLRDKTGLPIHPYFSALKIRWLLDNVPEVKKAFSEKRLMVGTVDSYLIWMLTGGPSKVAGLHMTDITNASRTMLLNINTLAWDPALCSFFGIPMEILPQVRSSSEIYGYLQESELEGTPICGCLGDQMAALVGQGCLEVGMAKNTYGTGCFLLSNVGTSPIPSKHGLLTTIGYQLGPTAKPVYALEGSVAIAGAAVRWLRDDLKILKDVGEAEKIASSVPNSAGVYFVPAFSGLFAPYWRPDARGAICGLTQFSNHAHLVRACLESVCFQTRELLEAMEKDSGQAIKLLKADGGMSKNNLLMQIQANLSGIPVMRPHQVESTALGAAVVAGLAVGLFLENSSLEEPSAIDIFKPTMKESDRELQMKHWRAAVDRSLGWTEIASGSSGSLEHGANKATLNQNRVWICGTVSGLLGIGLGVGVALLIVKYLKPKP